MKIIYVYNNNIDKLFIWSLNRKGYHTILPNDMIMISKTKDKNKFLLNTATNTFYTDAPEINYLIKFTKKLQ